MGKSSTGVPVGPDGHAARFGSALAEAGRDAGQTLQACAILG